MRVPRVRFMVGGMMIAVVFLGFTLGLSCGPGPAGPVPRPAAPLKLTLIPAGAQRPDHVVVELTVTNAGDIPLVWDSAFSTFVRWSVETFDGTALRAESVSDLQQPSPDDLGSRFVTIQPGCSLSKQVELTNAVQSFGSGHSYPAHQPTGFEGIDRFPVPRTAQGLRIQARYDLHPDDRDGFHVWFQRPLDEIGLWQGESEPAQLSVSF